MGQHTIVLLQPTSNKATRTFMDYETIQAAMDGKCVVLAIDRASIRCYC